MSAATISGSTATAFAVTSVDSRWLRVVAFSMQDRGALRRQNGRTPHNFCWPNHGDESREGFWHEEQTMPEGRTAKLMQIFVRPQTVNLKPSLQLKDIGVPEANAALLVFLTDRNAKLTHAGTIGG